MRKTEPFNCAYYTYKGPMDGLALSLGEFAQAVQAAGYELTDERRLVFANPKGGSAVEIEIQLGIQ